MKKANKILTILIFIFLYIPMAVLIVGSFNQGKSLARFDGFTLMQYVELFRDQDLLALLGNSILISILSSFIATVFGTFSCVGHLVYAQSTSLRNRAGGKATDRPHPLPLGKRARHHRRTQSHKSPTVGARNE